MFSLFFAAVVFVAAATGMRLRHGLLQPGVCFGGWCLFFLPSPFSPLLCFALLACCLLNCCQSWFDAQKAQGKQVVSLGGYSGAGYEDEARAEQEVERRLKSLSRSRTIINGGVTSDGIGDIGYRVAKRLGFQTVGIVSAKAIQNKDANGNLIAPSVSKDVDRSFFVKDDTWGGRGADGKLSPTSEAWVRNSDRYIAVGGNAVARDEAMEMLNRGKRVNVVQMDLNREKLRKKMAAKTAKARETDPNAPEQGSAPCGNVGVVLFC